MVRTWQGIFLASFDPSLWPTSLSLSLSCTLFHFVVYAFIFPPYLATSLLPLNRSFSLRFVWNLFIFISFPLLIYVEGALYLQLALMSPCPISLLSWVHHLSFLTQEDPVGPDSMRFESSIKPQTAVSSLLPSRNGYIHALYDSGNHNSEMMSSFFVCVCVCCEMFFSGAPL